MNHRRRSLFGGPVSLYALVLLALAVPARAGTFSMADFVAPGEFSIGIEPEVMLSDGAGFATNVKYTQGLTDNENFIGTIGTGTGGREFRVGGAMTFEFFPDTASQPGMGLGAQAMYYRLADQGELETTAIPYIHKSFRAGGADVDPFFSLPVGFAFSNGQYQEITSASIGSLFKASEHFSYVAELGLALHNTQSYVSGGVVYSH